MYITIFDFKDGNACPNHVTAVAFTARFLIHRSNAVAAIINYMTSPAWVINNEMCVVGPGRKDKGRRHFILIILMTAAASV
jgi:hypothetical protein